MTQFSDYRKSISGPGLSLPFRVVEGVVVIHLARNRSIVIPAGGAWPGLAHLSETLIAHLKPRSSSCLPQTRTEPDDEAGRGAAIALVLAQALTAVGPLQERFTFASEYGLPLREVNQRTAGQAIGTTRESFSKVAALNMN